MKAPPGNTFRELAAGARDTIPMMVGAAPFGVIFGTLVTASPLSLWHGQLMSLAVFAGSAQFIAVGLIAGHASFAVIWATTLIVNLRHLLYSATLAPYVAHLPARWRWTLGALMTDEVFAVAYAHYQKRAPGETGPHYFFGSGLAMYLNWQLWTLVGLVFGAAFPGLQALGLDFAMVATFIAIIVPQLVARAVRGGGAGGGRAVVRVAGLAVQARAAGGGIRRRRGGHGPDGDREPSAHSGAHAMNSLIDNVSSSYVLLILGMALVTYLIRAAVFVFGDKLAFPPLVRTALSFVPVTVLTAIIVPMTVSPHGNGAELTWRNAQLVAAIVAIGVCVATRRPLLTIAVSLAVFFFWQLVVLA